MSWQKGCAETCRESGLWFDDAAFSACSCRSEVEIAVRLKGQKRAILSRARVTASHRWLGCFGALAIAVTAPRWRLSGVAWRLSVPGVPHDGVRPFTAIVFLVGVALLSMGWIGLMAAVEQTRDNPRQKMRTVLLACAFWFVPVLLGPPLLSSDVYSYGAEGEMVTQGLDPTSGAMADLVQGPFVARTDPIWRLSAGNGYGPVFMGTAAALVTVSGHDPDLSVWLFKLLALTGVALAGWGITRLARQHGVDPALAVAFGIANPIVVLHVVGGAHNDGMLMGLLCAGAALAGAGRWRWGVTLMAMGAAVKLPGAAAIVLLAWCRPPLAAAIKERIRSVAMALAGSFAVILVWCLVVGIGFGWVGAMRNAGTTKGTLAVTTQIGFVVTDLLRGAGWDTNSDLWIGIFRLLGLALAGVACVILLHRSPQIGAVRATALALLAVVLCGPVVWPWYLGPALALLGTVDVGRWRASAIVLTCALSAEVFPTGVNSRPVGESSHLLSLLFIVAIGAGAYWAPRIVDWWLAGHSEPAGVD